jgi:hypothetical protein
MKYVLIHCIDPDAGPGTEGMPKFDSWLAEMIDGGVTRHGDRLRGSPEAAS